MVPTCTELRRRLALVSILRSFCPNFGRGATCFVPTITRLLSDEDENSPLVPLIDWLDYNGFSVVTKPMKSFTDSQGNRKLTGNMDVEIAVDAMEMAQHVGHIVLFSGDGDFCSVVQAVQRRGVKVTVVSSIASRPPICADELRRQADEFIDLVDLRAKISREGRPLRDVAHAPSLGVGVS